MSKKILFIFAIFSITQLTACGDNSSSVSSVVRRASCRKVYSPISSKPEKEQEKFALKNDSKEQKLPDGVYSLSGVEIHYFNNKNNKSSHIHMKKVIGLDQTQNKKTWVTQSICGSGINYELINTLDASILGITRMEVSQKKFLKISAKEFNLKFNPTKKSKELVFTVKDLELLKSGFPKGIYTDSVELFLIKNKNGIYELTAIYKKDEMSLSLKTKFNLCSQSDKEEFKFCSAEYNF